MDRSPSPLVDADVLEPVVDQPAIEQPVDRHLGLEEEAMELEEEAGPHADRDQRGDRQQEPRWYDP